MTTTTDLGDVFRHCRRFRNPVRQSARIPLVMIARF